MTDLDPLRSERAQALAIAQAVRDALVDRTLHEHAARLNHINGSQRETAASLAAVDKKVDGLVALATASADRSGWVLKRWQLWTGILGVIAAYGTMILVVVTSHP